MRFLPLFLIFVMIFGCTQSSGGQQASAPATQDTGAQDIVAYEHTEVTDEGTTVPEATSLKSEEISYKSIGWNIYATLYPAQSGSPDKAIILMPMLGKTRDSYPISFIERLHDEIPGAVVLTVDSRGHGKSTNLGSYSDFDSYTFRDMQSDILDAMPHLVSKYPSIKQYYVVGASIGSTAAIMAGARDSNIAKIVMLSPGIEYQGVNIERAVDDYRFELLLVASSGDSYSVSSINEIESASSSQITKKIYSGSAHGTDMFGATENDAEPLTGVIMQFLKK